MDKKKQIQFNLNNFLLSTSQLFDAVEAQVCQVSQSHSKRVAYIAIKLGLEFNYEAKFLFDLCAYALMHDAGLGESMKKDQQAVQKAQEMANKLPFLNDEENILKYVHEAYDGSGLYGLKEEQIPLFSQFIHLADHLDCSFDLSNPKIKNRKSIIEYVQSHENKLFSSDMVECFVEFAQTTAFWLDLQNDNAMLHFIFQNIQDFSITPSFEEALEYTQMISSLIKEESSLVSRAQTMAQFYNFEHKDQLTFMMAASVVKWGKLMIQEPLLYKDATLTLFEKESIQGYSYYSKQVLSNILGFSDIATWASRAQENIDGSGYPYALDASSLSLKDRLMRCLVMYDALRSKRVYKEGFTHDQAIEMMLQQSHQGKIDEAIVKDLDTALSE